MAPVFARPALRLSRGFPFQARHVMLSWNEMTDQPKKKRGFAAMDPERRRAIARKGGFRASELGKAHRWTSEEAKEARAKSGTVVKDGDAIHE